MSIFRPMLRENEKDARFALVVLAKKTSITCTHCHISVCNEHANVVCNDYL